MIYTVTVNPSVDYYVVMDKNIEIGNINKFSDYHYEAGGKGLNVSMVLHNQGIPTVAYFFSGGFTGAFIAKELDKYNLVKKEEIQIEGINRINVKVRSTEECDFNSTGPIISEEEQKQLIKKLDDLKENDFVLVCGGLAKGVSQDFLIEIAQKVNAAKAHFVLDTAPLSMYLIKECKPFLIKPNLDELAGLFPDNQVEMDNFKEYTAKVLKNGCENILLSLGGDGSYFEGELGCYRVKGPTLKMVDSVGAGDTLLASFIGEYSKSQNIVQSLTKASAAGCAAVTTYGLPTQEQINNYLNAVVVDEE